MLISSAPSDDAGASEGYNMFRWDLNEAEQAPAASDLKKNRLRRQRLRSVLLVPPAGAALFRASFDESVLSL
eukprot:4998964-Amphidinium_carterae.1